VHPNVDKRSFIRAKQRNDAFIQELKVQNRKFEGLQKDLATKLDALGKQDSSKITSDNYCIGFESSHVRKAKQGETAAGDTKIELLNPKSSLAEANSDSSNNAATPGLGGNDEEKVRASPAAKKFAEIPVPDYRASQAYILSHPEMLRNESDTDALLVDAYYAIQYQNDKTRARQHVHQAMLLQYCRMVGRGGVPVFFRRIATPGQAAREVFENDVAERFRKLHAIAKRDGKQRLAVDEDTAVEQFQLYPVGPNTSIPIQVPPAESEDEEVRKARSVFEQFAPDMRAALETGSLDGVNKALGKMEAEEAEEMVSLLHEVTSSCPVYCAS
jgi:cell division cycle protein 37